MTIRNRPEPAYASVCEHCKALSVFEGRCWNIDCTKYIPQQTDFYEGTPKQKYDAGYEAIFGKGKYD